MTRNTFIANLGGMVGVAMGMSLVSIFEILFFCFSFFAKSVNK